MYPPLVLHFYFLFSHSHSHFLINTSSPFPQHLHSCFLFSKFNSFHAPCVLTITTTTTPPTPALHSPFIYSDSYRSADYCCPFLSAPFSPWHFFVFGKKCKPYDTLPRVAQSNCLMIRVLKEDELCRHVLFDNCLNASTYMEGDLV